MKTQFLIFGILFISLAGFSQETNEQQIMTKKEQRQLAKEHRIAIRKAEEEKNIIMTDSMMNQHRFVLEADYVSGRTGTRNPVSSYLNFILIDSSEVILQLGSNAGIGYNGVGGITIDGNVTKYEVSRKAGKKGTSYSGTIYIMSNLGSYDIQFWATPSGQADATVRGSTRGMITYSGHLVPLNKSRVYKAKAI
jgi:hypothetical protein